MILLPTTRQRIARIPFLFRADSCLDETGLYALSYGQRVYAVHARTGAAELVDQDGRPIRVPGGMPRVHAVWNGSSRVPALLLEAAGANGFTYSEDISNAAWTKTAATVTGPVAGPTGKLSAYRLVENAATTAHYFIRDIAGVTAGAEQSMIVDVRANGRHQIKLYIADQATQANRVEVRANLTTGVLSSLQSAGTGSGARAQIEPLGNRYWRIRLAGVPASAATTIRFYLVMTENGSTDSYTGDGVSGVDVDHFGAEVGKPWALSRMDGGASAGARGADSLYFPLAARPQEMTVYVSGVEQQQGAGITAPRILQIGGAGNTDPRLAIYKDSLDSYRLLHDPAASSESDSATSIACSQAVEIRGTLAADGAPSIAVSVDSGAEAIATAGTAQAIAASWSDVRLYLNSIGTANVGAFAYRSVAVVPGAVDLDELRDLCEVG